MSSILDAALDYLQRGYSVIPCKMIAPEDLEAARKRIEAAHQGGSNDAERKIRIEKEVEKFIKGNAKIPTVKWGQYRLRQTTDAEAREWFTNCDQKRTAIGIVTGAISGISVVDVDSFDLLPILKAHGIGSPLVSRTGKGIQLIYSYDPRLPTTTNYKGIDKLDTRNDGGYIIAPPSQHYLGTTYHFLNNPDAAELSTPPEWLLTLPDKQPQNSRGEKDKSFALAAQSVDLDQLRSALAVIPADDYDTWLKIGLSLKHELGEVGLEIWREWSATCKDKYDPDEIDNKWDGFKDEHPNPVTLGTIYHYAKESGWTAPTVSNRKESLGGEFSGVEILCAADITPCPVKWLWLGWLAAGKLHILAGSPGTGKTTCAYTLAATITTGGVWPDRSKCADPGDVMIWSGEDSAPDTIVPRLMAAGADLSRVHIIQSIKTGEEKRAFDPAKDITLLFPAAEKMRPRMLIVDSIVSAVAGDSHKNTETRRGLQPLVDLGEKFGIAILGISHFTKNTSGKDPLDRVTGSLAFGALARIVLAAAKMPPGHKSGHERIFARVKSNIGPDGNGFGYSLATARVEGIETVRVDWSGAVNGNPKELLGESADTSSSLNEARKFLYQLLEDGPKPAKHVKEHAKDAGISGSTLDRAKSVLNIVASKDGFKGGWVWTLPPR